jgi:hypothetical protein
LVALLISPAHHFSPEDGDGTLLRNQPVHRTPLPQKNIRFVTAVETLSLEFSLRPTAFETHGRNIVRHMLAALLPACYTL